MSDTKNNDPTTETKKKKSKLPLLIGLVVVLLLGGGGGFYLWTRMAHAADEKAAEKDAKGKKAKAKAEEHAAEPAGDGHGETKDAAAKLSLPDDEEVTSVIELQPFIVNLADIEQARYLRLTVSVGVGGESHGEEKPNPLFMTRVKNAMLSVLTTKSSTDVLTVEGKQKLREELLKAAQAVSHEPEIHAIYITDFIVQL